MAKRARGGLFPVRIIEAIFAAVLILLAGVISCRPDEPAENDPVIGVKIYDDRGDLGPLLAEWTALGVNTAFVGEPLLANAEFRSLARKNGITLYLIAPVFQNPEVLQQHPEWAAVTDRGEPAREEWVRFVCPTRKEYRDFRTAEIRRLVKDLDPDVLSLDFIRFFVFWEMVQPDRALDSLPRTCFCPSCLEDFRRTENIAWPGDLSGTGAVARWILDRHPREWTDWKCRVVASAVRDLAAAAREVKPAIKVNLHLVPWRADDFGGAVRTVAGQDLDLLAPLADFLSPMCYHHMVGRNPEWIHSVVAEMSGRTGAAVLPSIQVDKAYTERDLSPAEFETALGEALKPPSRGVVFWNWDALAASGEKREAVRKIARRGR